MNSIFLESENFDFLKTGLWNADNNHKSIAEKNSMKKKCKNNSLLTKNHDHHSVLVSSLYGLIDSMKTSFLPSEKWDSSIRQVIVRDSDSDPMIVLKKNDNTIVIGSGIEKKFFGSKEHVVFPDMRLLFSEKSRIQGWILLDDSIDVSTVLVMLEILDFPVIYATRSVITHFRHNISDEKILQKIRFFELFSENTYTRNIGGMEFSLVKKDNNSYLALNIWNSYIAYKMYSYTDCVECISGAAKFLQKKSNIWACDDFFIEEWEIVSFQELYFSKKSMKFTFDKFIIDGNSVGAVGGYVISDRGIMADSGVVIFSMEEDIRARTIAWHIFIDSRWFVYGHEVMTIHKELIKAIRIIYEEAVARNPQIDKGQLVQIFRKELQKVCMVLTGRIPIIMPIITEKRYMI